MKINLSIAVILLMFAAFSFGCKKKQSSAPYIAKMGGQRIWSGVNTYMDYLDTVSHHRNITDTPCTIIISGGNTINAFGNLLNFTKADNVAKTVTYNYTNNNSYDISIQLTYFYENDSMVYDHEGWHHNIGGSVQLHTN